MAVQLENRYAKRNFDLTFIRQHLDLGETINDIAKELNTDHKTLKKYLTPEELERGRANARRKISEQLSEWNRSTEARQRLTDRNLVRWQDPEYRRQQSEAFEERIRVWEQEHPGQRSELMSAWWREHPEQRRQQSEALSEQNRERWRSPEFRQQQSESQQERWQDPELRKQQSDRMIDHWGKNDFWEWISQFPNEKQKQILKAIHTRNLTV